MNNIDYLSEYLESIFQPLLEELTENHSNNFSQKKSNKKQIKFDLPETKQLANIIFDLQENLKRNNNKKVLDLIETLQINLDILKTKIEKQSDTEKINKFKNELLAFLNKAAAFEIDALTKEVIIQTINNLSKKYEIQNKRINSLIEKIKNENKINKMLIAISNFIDEDL